MSTEFTQVAAFDFSVFLVDELVTYGISARRSNLGLRVALVALHLVYVGVLFLFDIDLTQKTLKETW